uniref:Elongation factor G 1 n=1 Tax=Lygus hesperus TaxID=30085 RepID=A0A146KKQ4_LYGHE
MRAEVDIPDEFQGNVVGDLTRRRGTINDVSVRGDGYCRIDTVVPLKSMFGYATDLRSQTQGKGEFTMVYHSHKPMLQYEAEAVIAAYRSREREVGEEISL